MIVDDEELGRLNLRCALAEHSGWTVVAESASVEAANAVLAVQAVDVVFLDIHMPRQSGMVLASALANQAVPPLVIFVTAHNAFALEAFEVHALDYLLKPVNDERLTAALARARSMLAQRERAAYARALGAYVADAGAYLRQLSVRSIGSIESIALVDVLWIEACGNYVKLHTAGRSVMYRSALSRLAERLDPTEFMQVHRGTMIRCDQLGGCVITGDGTYRVRLRCGAELDASERQTPAIRQRLGLLVARKSVDR